MGLVRAAIRSRLAMALPNAAIPGGARPSHRLGGRGRRWAARRSRRNLRPGLCGRGPAGRRRDRPYAGSRTAASRGRLLRRYVETPDVFAIFNFNANALSAPMCAGSACLTGRPQANLKLVEPPYSSARSCFDWRTKANPLEMIRKFLQLSKAARQCSLCSTEPGSLRLRNGARDGMPYAALSRSAFDPSGAAICSSGYTLIA